MLKNGEKLSYLGLEHHVGSGHLAHAVDEVGERDAGAQEQRVVDDDPHHGDRDPGVT